MNGQDKLQRVVNDATDRTFNALDVARSIQRTGNVEHIGDLVDQLRVLHRRLDAAAAEPPSVELAARLADDGVEIRVLGRDDAAKVLRHSNVATTAKYLAQSAA